jgi:hypothetical protein
MIRGDNMTRLEATIANLRKYVQEHPKELQEIKDYVTDIADKLQSGELSTMQMSLYFKQWKKPHGHILYQIFADAYQKAC